MNTSRQLTDLIKNKARSLGIDAQLLLKRYFMEQMLARIAVSKYKTNFILKGGILISSMVGLSSRATQDIDVSIINKPLTKDEIEKMITEICNIDIGDNIRFELTSIQDIREEFEYPGIRLSFKVYMDKIVDSFKMDITTGDTITPKEIVYGYKLLLEDKTIKLCSYSIETIIAEKIESILSKNILGTRMRDYYDLYLQPDVPAYRITQTWGELNEQGQQKHMARILELYDSKQCEFNEYMWASTKGNVQSQYLNMFINAIRKNEKESESTLKRLWENTNDTVQNSSVGRTFIESVSIEERKELYKVSNSKLQSQLLAQDIRKYINSGYNFNSPLVQDLFNTKDKVYEMNVQYLFANIKQKIDYLDTFLDVCPDKIKEKYSSAIGKYFSSNLELFANSGKRYQDMLLRSANYLDVISSGILIENFFRRDLGEAKIELVGFEKLGLVDPNHEPSVAEEYWKAIKIEKQKRK